MKGKIGLLLGIAASLMLISAGLTFSQEETVQGGAVPEAQTEPEMQWVWGEVVSVDAPNKMLTVKYLDYETDQEKELTIKVDEATTYENTKSIDEIEPNATLSIDYIVSSGGENIAKNISLEEPEATPAPQQGATQETSEEATAQETLEPVTPAGQ